MTGPRRVTITRQNQVEILINAGRKIPEIADALGLAHRTILKYAKKLRELGRVTRPPAKAGRPCLVKDRLLRNIRSEALHGALSTKGDLLRHLQEKYAIQASSRTAKRLMKRCGIISCRRRKRGLLKRQHFMARLAFARRHKSWTIEDWGKVLFSDESRFNLKGSDGPLRCFRVPGARLRPRDVQGVTKHGGGGLMVWGCMTSRGVGTICPLQGAVNTEVYLQVCGPQILRAIWDRWGLAHSQCTFQQDNATPHVSRPALAWFREHGIRVMIWPAQSPDLNPIEHLWAVLKRKQRYWEQPANLDALWLKIQEEWAATMPDICQRLVESMPRRLAAVIKAKGGYTKD